MSFSFELMQDGGLERPKPRPEGKTHLHTCLHVNKISISRYMSISFSYICKVFPQVYMFPLAVFFITIFSFCAILVAMETQLVERILVCGLQAEDARYSASASESRLLLPLQTL